MATSSPHMDQYCLNERFRTLGTLRSRRGNTSLLSWYKSPSMHLSCICCVSAVQPVLPQMLSGRSLSVQYVSVCVVFCECVRPDQCEPAGQKKQTIFPVSCP